MNPLNAILAVASLRRRNLIGNPSRPDAVARLRFRLCRVKTSAAAAIIVGMVVSLVFVFIAWEDWSGTKASKLSPSGTRVLIGLGLFIGTFVGAVIAAFAAVAIESIVDGAQRAGIAFRAAAPSDARTRRRSVDPFSNLGERPHPTARG
jgi:hypothetical protein